MHHINQWNWTPRSQNIYYKYSCGVCVCVCVCLFVYAYKHICNAHHENTPDGSYFTSSSHTDWLWLRLDRHDCRKLMSESSSHRCTFCRCCAVATLEATLHQSSVVGYKCKTIQCDNTIRSSIVIISALSVVLFLHNAAFLQLGPWTNSCVSGVLRGKE